MDCIIVAKGGLSVTCHHAGFRLTHYIVGTFWTVLVTSTSMIKESVLGWLVGGWLIDLVILLNIHVDGLADSVNLNL